MTTLQEALQQAAEYVDAVPDDRGNASHIDREKLVEALKTALAQQGEPDLSALSPKGQTRIREWIADGTLAERAIGVIIEQERELRAYEKAAPAPAQDVPETNFGNMIPKPPNESGETMTPLVASQPLSDDQIKAMWAQYCGYPGGIFDFARAIESAHGIGGAA